MMYKGFEVKRITRVNYVVYKDGKRAMPEGKVSLRTLREAKAFVDAR